MGAEEERYITKEERDVPEEERDIPKKCSYSTLLGYHWVIEYVV